MRIRHNLSDQRHEFELVAIGGLGQSDSGRNSASIAIPVLADDVAVLDNAQYSTMLQKWGAGENLEACIGDLDLRTCLP